MAIGFNVPHIMQSMGGLQQQEMPAILQNMPQPMPQPVEQKKPGLFGQGGKGWMALGIIGDALQAMDGGQGTYMPAMIDMREQAAKERARLNEIRMRQQQAIEDRQSRMADAIALKQWERDNPGPTEFQRNYQWLDQTDKKAAASYKSRMTNDVTWRQGPDGQWYPIQNPTTPTAPVGKLTPLTEGGPTPRASGGF